MNIKLIQYVKIKIGNFLVSDFIYKWIVQRTMKKSYYFLPIGKLNIENQSTYIQSLIYWNIYEKSEIKTISKYLDRHCPVIELGASIGMTTLTICSLVDKNVPVISVEANPLLINNLNNTKHINNLSNLDIVHAAIDYEGGGSIQFSIDANNLGSKKGSSSSSVIIKTVKLRELILNKNIKRFSLISDIEGAEVELFLLEDVETFSGCELIIIELHDITYKDVCYTKNDIAEVIIKRFSMRILKTDGKTWVFGK